MKLVVGLGNPGQKYKNTRHNVGFLVVDRLALHSQGRGHSPPKICKDFLTKGIHPLIIDKGMGEEKVVLVKPQLFMNKSGVAVKAILKKHPKVSGEDLYIVYDDLDIELGKYKIGEKGPREHNGLRSIYEQIGIKDFKHVRIGIDNRPGIRRVKLAKNQKSKGYSPLVAMDRSQWMTGEEYVLSKWKPEERKKVKEVIEKVARELKNVFS